MQHLVVVSLIKNHKLFINLKFNIKNWNFRIKESNKYHKPKTKKYRNYKINLNSLFIRFKRWVLNLDNMEASITLSLNIKADFLYLGNKLIALILFLEKKLDNLVMSIIDIKYYKMSQQGDHSTSVNFRLKKISLTKKICNCKWIWQRVSEV